MSIEINTLGDIAGRFDISNEEAERIAAVANTEQEFVSVWQSKDWWTDENAEATPEQYRFDSATGEIFEYDKSQKSYVYLGTYHAYGIAAKMSDAKRIESVEKQKERDWLVENS